MNRTTSIRTLGFLTGVIAAAGNAHAYLGGFEPADGYQGFLNRVQDYNAGHYGPNSGYGGVFTPIASNTDFWHDIVGGTGGSYGTGHQGYDRTWINSGIGTGNEQGLVLTTCALGWGGPALEFKYDLDAADLGGVAPSSTPGAKVNMSFWWRGTLSGVDSQGQVPEGYFGDAIQFRDSSNNVGFQLGVTQHVTGDKVTLWNGSSLFETAIPATGNKYDRWDLSFDLTANTFSATYFQFIGSITTPLVVNQPLMTPMNDFSILDFRTSDGVFNNKGNGLNLDDFSANVVVPEPSTLGALGIVAASLLMRRRRRA